jgi:hypothetical protein
VAAKEKDLKEHEDAKLLPSGEQGRHYFVLYFTLNIKHSSATGVAFFDRKFS